VIIMTGTKGDDTILSRYLQVTAFGLGGNDLINGSEPYADLLYGSAGNDHLFADAGADTLRGGTGQGTFHFRSAADSTPGQMDMIKDLKRGVDGINLSLIDTNTATATDDAFKVRYASATTQPKGGELVLSNHGSYQLITGHVNDDGSPDLMIRVDTAVPLTASDFHL
jgi:serralysin